jgi:hypothetical protein
MWTPGHVALRVVKVTMGGFRAIGFQSPFGKPILITRRLVVVSGRQWPDQGQWPG